MEVSRRDGVMPAEMNLLRDSLGRRGGEVFAVVITLTRGYLELLNV